MGCGCGSDDCSSCGCYCRDANRYGINDVWMETIWDSDVDADQMVTRQMCIVILIRRLSLFYFSDKHISLMYYRDNLQTRGSCYVCGSIRF